MPKKEKRARRNVLGHDDIAPARMAGITQSLANHPMRGNILEHASKALADMQTVLVERGGSYADIADNGRVFRSLMESLGIQIPVGMTDVEFHSLSNICTKLARLTTGSRDHQDNWVDIANYATLQLADMRRNIQDRK